MDIEGDVELVHSRISQQHSWCLSGSTIIAEVLAYLKARPLLQLQVIRRNANAVFYSVARQPLLCLLDIIKINLTVWVNLRAI